MSLISGASRNRGRPRAKLPRPERIAVRDGLVRCYYDHGRCTFSAGPYPTRDAAVSAAIAHYERRHKRPSHAG